MGAWLERKLDRKVQKEILNFCANKWRKSRIVMLSRWNKNGKLNRFDCKIYYSDGEVGYGQVNGRNYPMGHPLIMRQGYMVGKNRFLAGRKLESQGFVVLQIVGWEDGNIQCFCRDELDGVKTFDLGGRTDRGYEKDIETCAYLDMKQFKYLGRSDRVRQAISERKEASRKRKSNEGIDYS